MKQQVFIWYAGLIRGAIAYAMTYRIDKSIEVRENDIMIIR